MTVNLVCAGLGRCKGNIGLISLISKVSIIVEILSHISINDVGLFLYLRQSSIESVLIAILIQIQIDESNAIILLFLYYLHKAVGNSYLLGAYQNTRIVLISCNGYSTFSVTILSVNFEFSRRDFSERIL